MVRSRHIRTGALAASVVVAAAACAHDIGSLGGHHGSAAAINASSVVVGASAPVSGKSHAFVQVNGGSLVDLGTGSKNSSIATAVNASGVVVGATATVPSSGAPPRLPFRWTQAGGLVELPLPDLETSAQAIDINAGGTIIVNAYRKTPAHSIAPYVFDAATSTYTSLPDLGQGQASVLAIADDGTIVGWARTAAGGHHAVKWAAGTHAITDLDPGPTLYSEAADINASGVVVGNSGDGTIANSRAVVWSGATRHDLGAGEARGINAAGTVVGWSVVPSGEHRAWLWDLTNGASIELGVLSGGGYSEANAINDFGFAVGMSNDGSGDDRPVRFDQYLTPTSAP